MDSRKKTIEIIGVPLDLGGNQRGACLAPLAMRIAGLSQKLKDLGLKVVDEGDVKILEQHLMLQLKDRKEYFSLIRDVCKLLSNKVYESLSAGHIPVSLGGDHSIAIGSLSGTSRWVQEKHKKIGLLWFDAHADINTPETSPSGNIHGMPLAVLLGQGYPELTNIGFPGPKLDPHKVALIGIRAIDDEEKKLCRKAGISYFTMRDIDERGMRTVMAEALTLVSDEVDALHISFDMDGVDPQFAPGVSTPVIGGLSYREAHLALEMAADTGKVMAMDMVELNPMKDIEGRSAALAVELIQSAMGKVII